jgi:hypothetical protein
MAVFTRRAPPFWQEYLPNKTLQYLPRPAQTSPLDPSDRIFREIREICRLSLAGQQQIGH